MFDLNSLPQDDVIVFSRDGQRVPIDASAAAACASVEQLMDVVSASLPTGGERCYRLLQVAPAYWRTNGACVDLSLPAAQRSSMRGGRKTSSTAILPCGSSGGTLLGPSCAHNMASPKSPLSPIIIKRHPSRDALKKTATTATTTTTTAAAAASAASAAGAANVNAPSQKGWICPPLPSLPLSALLAVDDWPLKGDAVDPSAMCCDASLSFTLPFQSSAVAVKGPPPPLSHKTSALTQALSSSSFLKAPPLTTGAISLPSSPSAASSASVSPYVRGETSPQSLRAVSAAPVVLIALTCKAAPPKVAAGAAQYTAAVAAGGVAATTGGGGGGGAVSPSSPEVRAAFLFRPQSCQSIASPTGKHTPSDALVQSSSSAQYGLSSNINPTLSTNSFFSLTTPLTHHNAGVTHATMSLTGPTTTGSGVVRGSPYGYVGATSMSSAAFTSASLNTWGMPNTSAESFTPTVAVHAPGEGFNMSFGPAAAALNTAALDAHSVCVAASRDVFPAQVGVFHKAKCSYGDTRFSRRAGGGGGGVDESSVVGAEKPRPALISAAVSNSSFPNNSSLAGVAAMPPRRGSGPLTLTSSDGAIFMNSGSNASFSSPFGTAGMLQPVPSFAHQQHATLTATPQQQHHQQQQLHHSQFSQLALQQAQVGAHHRFSPVVSATANPALCHSALALSPPQHPPAHASAPHGNTQPCPSPSPPQPHTSSSVMLANAPTTGPLPLWRNAVPPLPKAAISLTIALHIGHNVDVVRCLLRHYASYEREVMMAALQLGHPYLRSPHALDFVRGEARAAEDEGDDDDEEPLGGEAVYSSHHNSHLHQQHSTSCAGGDSGVFGSATHRNTSGTFARRTASGATTTSASESAAAFTPSSSFDADARHTRTLTASQLTRQTLLYRQYFAYLAACLEQQQIGLLAAISDVDRIARELTLPACAVADSLMSSAVSSSRAHASPVGAPLAAMTDDDELSASRAAKSTVPPSARSHESPQEWNSGSNRLMRNRSSDTFSYSTSGVYSLTRTLPPHSNIFEESARPDVSVPSRSPVPPTVTVPELMSEEVLGWLKLTPLTVEVKERLSCPLSFMDHARVGQLRRLRRKVQKVSPRTAAELRMTQLHTLLRGACDDEALAMEGLTYLLSITKNGRAGERNSNNNNNNNGGGVGVTEVELSVALEGRATAPEQRPTLARAFAAIQQCNEEVRWFTEVEGALAERRIKPLKLLELVEQLEKNPNAIVDIWYNAEEGMRETLRLTAQYLTRRTRVK